MDYIDKIIVGVNSVLDRRIMRLFLRKIFPKWRCFVPVSFIICGLLLIYIFCDFTLKNRWVYVILLIMTMAGFFVPVINLGVYAINPVLFLVPLVMAVLSCRGFETKDWAWLLTVLFLTLLEYMFAVKINNNLSLTISSLSLMVIAVNALFVFKRAMFPFVVMSVCLLQLVSGVFENYNQIISLLGSVEGMNFIALTVVVYGMFNFALQSLRRNCKENC